MSNGVSQLNWSEEGIDIQADTGRISTNTNDEVLAWCSDSSVTMAGPLTITANTRPQPDTSNARLVSGNPSVIAASLVCDGDIVTKGGGVYVLSDGASKHGVEVRNAEFDLRAVCDINAINFYYSAGAGHQHIGVLANSVQTHLPQAVRQDKMVQNVYLTPVDTRKYRVNFFNTSESEDVEILVDDRYHEANVKNGLIIGDFGDGGQFKIRIKRLFVDYQALAVASMNATRALAQSLKALEVMVEGIRSPKKKLTSCQANGN